MIHMGVGDERMTDPQQLPRCEDVELTEVEKQRSPLEEEVHVEPGLAEGIIDQLGMKHRPH